MPDSLEVLKAAYLRKLTKLPRLPTATLKQLDVSMTAMSKLPNSLPRLEELDCGGTLIQKLPALAGCLRALRVYGCEQLKQLPGLLPEHLEVLDCSYCSALEQLPVHLPPKLDYLHISGCTLLKRLPKLPPSLTLFVCSGCSHLQQPPDVAKCLEDLKLV